MTIKDISREDASGILATQELNEIVQGAAKTSVALETFRTVRMTAGTTRMPVLAALPSAGWVTESATEDSGVKPTTEMKWTSKNLVAEEIAVIVPVHENVIADAQFDIWGEVRPQVEAAFGRVLDRTVFFGENKPATWTDQAIVPGATAASNTVQMDGSKDLAESFNEVFAKVEEDGFDVNRVYAANALKPKLRGLRDKNGQPIYLNSIRSDNSMPSIYGEPLHFVTNGAWKPDTALAVAGDASNAILGIREDVSVKLLTEATVGGVNLAERDMVALRFKFRVGFAVANPIQPGVENGYPFAVLTPQG